MGVGDSRLWEMQHRPRRILPKGNQASTRRMRLWQAVQVPILHGPDAVLEVLTPVEEPTVQDKVQLCSETPGWHLETVH